MQNSKFWYKTFFLLTTFACLISFLWLFKAFLLGSYPDFNTQYFVPKMILSGLNPYIGGSNLFTTQVYPPTIFFVFLPISFLPQIFASYLYVALSIIALVISMYLISRTFEFKFFGLTNLLLMLLTFISFPVKFTLGMGQINIFILLLLAITLWFIKEKREFMAGIFLGVSIVLKLFPLFLPIYLLLKFKKGNRGLALPWTRMRVWFRKEQLRDDLEMLDGLLVVIALAALLVIIFIPKELYLEFLFKTLPNLSSSWKTDYYNQALTGLIGRAFGTDQLGNLLRFCITLIITMPALFLITKNDDDRFKAVGLKFGTLITLSLMLNNFSWQHHFVWLVIPFYSTIYYLSSTKVILGREKSVYYGILVISYLLVSINFVDPKILLTIFQSHVFFGTLMLLFIQFKLLIDKR